MTLKQKYKSLVLFGMMLFIASSYKLHKLTSHTLTVEVNDLRNDKGVVQFALYNKEGTIPDEKYKKYYKIGTSKIENGSARYEFKYLIPGKYAVNIFHDENDNGEIDKGLMLPKEGIGFSNYRSIGLTNKPNFNKAGFELLSDKKIEVKIIYF